MDSIFARLLIDALFNAGERDERLKSSSSAPALPRVRSARQGQRSLERSFRALILHFRSALLSQKAIVVGLLALDRRGNIAGGF